MKCVKRLRLYICLFTILLCISSSTALPIYGQTQKDNLITLKGQVTDDLTDLPIKNATIMVWTEEGTLKSSNKTDSKGYYEIVTEGGFECRLYVYYDDPSTPGFDYVPAFVSSYLQEGTEENNYKLVPAASIFLQKDILFVESSDPPSKIVFTVIDPDTESPLSSNNRVCVYDTETGSHNQFLGLSPQHIVIPADVGVNIEVKSTVFVEKKLSYKTFFVNIPEQLSKGQAVELDLREYSLQFNLDLVKDLINTVGGSLNDMERKGFYVITEKNELLTVGGLIEEAENKFTQDLYEECYADLREVFIYGVNLNKRLEHMLSEASVSAIILIIFLAFTATALAYLFLESEFQKALISCVLYVVLLLALYVTYPGCLIIKATEFLKTATTSLGIAFSFAFIAPRLIKERAFEGRIAFRSAVTAVFALAKRNLKRRRLRFALTLITVIILVMSFVALTSFSMGYGLIAKPLETATPPSDGLLVMKPLPFLYQISTSPVIETFDALDQSDVNWAQGKPETVSVAPKVENLPKLSPLGTLALEDTPVQSIQLFGVLGISPSTEANITYIDSVIVDGRYLQDKDENTILISAVAAERLDADVGDRFLLHFVGLSMRVELVGIFDDDLFNQLSDLNGALIAPKKVILSPLASEEEPKYEVVSCDPSEIVITTYQTTTGIHGVFISRIDIQINESQDLLPLARRMALERDYWVWTAVGGQVYLTSLKSYFEVRGLPVIVPWLIVILNVVITMLNAIFERRREIGILSSIGLNPSHITALFVAEASIIGIIGGGVGYLSGLSLYRLMSALSIAIEVRQKVSAVWCLGALGIAATAVVIGAIVALRSSVIVTPSLLRRWRVEEKAPALGEPWVFTLPIKVPQSEINSFNDYFMRNLERHKGDFNVGVDGLNQTVEETPKSITKRIKFTYHYGRGSLGAFITVNELVAIKRKEQEFYNIKLTSKGAQDWAYKTANFIRTLVFKWSPKNE